MQNGQRRKEGQARGKREREWLQKDGNKGAVIERDRESRWILAKRYLIDSLAHTNAANAAWSLRRAARMSSQRTDRAPPASGQGAPG